MKKIKPEMVNTILAYLQKKPYEQVYLLINELLQLEEIKELKK